MTGPVSDGTTSREAPLGASRAGRNGGKNRVTGPLPKPSPDVEVGVSAFLPFVTPYKNAWEALRTEEVTVRQLKAMRKTDGQARALYRLITLPIRAAVRTATFVPESNVDGGDEEAKFIEQMFTLPSSGGGMTVPFGAVIAQMLLAIFEGFSAFEMVYWQPTSGPLKGKWTLKKLAARPSDTITFLLDDNSELFGLRQRTMYMGRAVDVTIPGRDVVVYTANAEEKPFYGESYFLSAFFHWDKKFKLYVVAHLAAQRAAVGTRIGTLPANPNVTEKVDFQRALADLGIAQWMTIPENYKVDSLKEAGAYDFLALINHHNSQMSKSVLAAFFDDSQGSGGDASLVDFGRQSDSLFLLMLQTVMGEVEEVINSQIIPRFIDWNFASGKYPRFSFGSLTEEQKGAMVDIFKTVAVGGQALAISPEFVHELEKQVAEVFGLEVDYDAVEERMQEQQDLQRQQEELAAQQGGQPPEPGAPPPGGGGAPTPPPGPGGGQPPAGPGGGAHPIVDPSLLPKGFTLTAIGDDTGGPADVDEQQVSLTDLAADLLTDAAAALTRGKAHVGYKVVETPSGATTYGVPVGTRITRDLRRKTAAHGMKGANYGGVRRDSATGGKVTRDDNHQVLGGGKGAPAQHPHVTAGGPAPRAVYGNPRQPGAELLDYGDGTVAVRDAHGVTSPRQRFEMQAFLRLGWQISHGPAEGAPAEAKAGDPGPVAAKAASARKAAPKAAARKARS